MKSPTALGVFLAGAATVLLGFVTFCTPVFEKLWLVESLLPQGKAQFGVLGYKVQDAVTSMHLGYPRQFSALDPYTLPSSIRTLSYVFVLFPIAFGLAGVTFFLAILGVFFPVVVGSMVAILSFFAAAVATTGFVIVIVAYFILKRHLDPALAFKFGTAFWLDVAAAIALFVASFFFGIGICCNVRRSRKERTAGDATMYNRLFAAPSERPYATEEHINMEPTYDAAPTEVPVISTGHTKSASYDTGVASTPRAEPYYPPTADEFEDGPGASSVALVPASAEPASLSYLSPVTAHSVQKSAPVLGPEPDTIADLDAGRRSSVLSSQFHSIENSEYEDARTAPTEHVAATRTTGLPVYLQNAHQVEKITTETPGAVRTTTITSPVGAAPRVGAYDPEPALPSHLRSGAGRQQLSDAWFLPGSSKSTSATAAGSSLPDYQDKAPGVYPDEKRAPVS
ncbi:hypothetical protein MBRA1_000554 [Malassezia brasiliensis]|uniref:Pali-domain-containing protein n=1 Tax=Malassezia brasiliensis TaxID=1821822 RepID=A0AAF0DQ73_9BASI|nr:hypothetical protein MBRA1_000554 [Malassezia brasiliensis]